MITLLPAILVIFGRWIFLAGQAGFRLGRAVQPRVLVAGRPGHRPPPRTVWMVTAILLAAGAAGMIGFKFGTLTTAQFVPRHPAVHRGAKRAIQVLPGRLGEPIDVISTASSASRSRPRWPARTASPPSPSR